MVQSPEVARSRLSSASPLLPAIRDRLSLRCDRSTRPRSLSRPPHLSAPRPVILVASSSLREPGIERSNRPLPSSCSPVVGGSLFCHHALPRLSSASASLSLLFPYSSPFLAELISFYGIASVLSMLARPSSLVPTLVTCESKSCTCRRSRSRSSAPSPLTPHGSLYRRFVSFVLRFSRLRPSLLSRSRSALSLSTRSPTFPAPLSPRPATFPALRSPLPSPPFAVHHPSALVTRLRSSAFSCASLAHVRSSDPPPSL